MSSSGRSGLFGKALAAIRRGAHSIPVTGLVSAGLILATIAALGWFWSLDRGPTRVAIGHSASPGSLPSPPTPSSAPPRRAPTPRDSPSPASSPTTVPQSIDPRLIHRVSGCLVPRRFSVLTFNIHGGRTHHGVDLPAVAAEIKAARADIVLLQEVDQNLARTGFRDEPHVLAAELGMNVYYRAPVRSNAILTAFPVIRWSSTPLPLWPGREQRRLVHATVLVDGQAVNVFTTHLDQSFPGLRVEQIRAAEGLMAPYTDTPTILGGDLNSGPGSAVLDSLRSRLQDSWAEVGQGPGNTVPAGSPRVRIDYLLHNSWLSPRAAQVLPSRASDHRSLRAVFDLWGRKDCGG